MFQLQSNISTHNQRAYSLAVTKICNVWLIVVFLKKPKSCHRLFQNILDLEEINDILCKSWSIKRMISICEHPRFMHWMKVYIVCTFDLIRALDQI